MGTVLEYKTALHFLEKIGMVDAEKLMRQNPLSFIKHLIRGYQEHVPFQCVSIIAQTKEEKHVPTIEEVVSASLSLEGGVCFTLNTFMCILLRTLNFKVDVLSGCYSSFGDSHNHVVLLLKDLRYADDNYIIDVGSGFAFDDPLPLNELPCSRYFAGQEYKYEWHDDVILRLHRLAGDILEGENVVFRGEWRQLFHFNLKSVSFDHFRSYMEGIYTDENCDFHKTLRANRFPPLKMAGNDERILLAFKNQSLLVGPMDDALKTKVSTEEWADKIKENFPTIPPAKVDLAVQKVIELAELIEEKNGNKSE